MAYLGPVHRWDLFWADLEPHVGSEQAGDRRPVLVVSNDEFNRHFPVVTTIPLTKMEGKQRRLYPFEVLLPVGVVGNLYTSIALPHQIRTLSKKRLLERIGALTDAHTRTEVEERLMDHLGIAFED